MSFTALPLNPQAQPAIPHAEQAMEDLDLALRLGPPGGGSHLNIDWDALEELHSLAYQPQLPPSPFRLPTTLEEIRNRLVLENMRFPQNLQRPLAEAEQLAQLKSQIIETMATLDEETFWPIHSLTSLNWLTEQPSIGRRLNEKPKIRTVDGIPIKTKANACFKLITA
ncbi:hypothetical protein Cni_G13158 [Canna indica]|uniref:Uncharacterized protein n=1 Tax=Canna indica TaxID=4628 RepID=A0AAQ3K9S0_9LILI|nr:hypothetical protein Cni_G13158 [Canna indica]